jgi:hypothetical protein
VRESEELGKRPMVGARRSPRVIIPCTIGGSKEEREYEGKDTLTSFPLFPAAIVSNLVHFDILTMCL